MMANVKTPIGLIGLGLMGGHLVDHLLRAGYEVYGFDIDPEKVNQVVRKGAKKVEDLSALSAHTQVIILSLPNSKTKLVWLWLRGKLHVLRLIEMGPPSYLQCM